MTINKRVAIMLTGVIVFALLAFGHVDWFPSIRTYGVSFGTNSRYCSVELVTRSARSALLGVPLASHIETSCESAH